MPSELMPTESLTLRSRAVVAMVTMGRWNVAYLIGTGVVVALVSGVVWLRASERDLSLLAQILGDLKSLWTRPAPFTIIAAGSFAGAFFQGSRAQTALRALVGGGIAWAHLLYPHSAFLVVTLVAGVFLSLLLFSSMDRKSCLA